jgi:hypothetical protein
MKEALQPEKPGTEGEVEPPTPVGIARKQPSTQVYQWLRRQSGEDYQALADLHATQVIPRHETWFYVLDRLEAAVKLFEEELRNNPILGAGQVSRYLAAGIMKDHSEVFLGSSPHFVTASEETLRILEAAVHDWLAPLRSHLVDRFNDPYHESFESMQDLAEKIILLHSAYNARVLAGLEGPDAALGIAPMKFLQVSA